MVIIIKHRSENSTKNSIDDCQISSGRVNNGKLSFENRTSTIEIPLQKKIRPYETISKNNFFR